MTPLKELTQKIHRHCPELLELSFGCEIHTEGNETSGHYVCRTEKGSLLIRYGDEYGVCPYPGYMQILGHPITLDAVMKAIKLSNAERRNSGKAISYSVILSELHGSAWTEMKPLSEQSPETIDWLNTIIV